MKLILLLIITHFLTTFTISSQPQQEKQCFETLFPTEKSEYIPYRTPPVIAAWFWGEEQLEPDGYKYFIDQVSRHSCYNLLSTAIRLPGRDITDIDVHNQVKQAVEYAKERGIKIALELDPRLACRKFKTNMQRVAFKMFLKPGFKEEYEKRHSAIWPELKKLLSDTGVRDYSIFWDKETNILFAIQKIDGEQSSQEIGINPIVRKWWDYMADIMEVNEDNSPISIPLKELFYMD